MMVTFDLTDPLKGSIPFNLVKFPDGHLHLDLSREGKLIEHKDEVIVKSRIRNGDDIFLLMQLVSFIKDFNPKVKRTLHVPYLMAGRYDRKMSKYDTFDLKLIGKAINSLGFDEVVVYEPHSGITEAVIDNCRVIHPLDIKVSQLCKSANTTVLVAPDIGAVKRVEAFIKEFNLDNELLILNKRRELKTGKILGIESLTPFNTLDKQYLIYDDLCDGGATFQFAAKFLRDHQAKRVTLAVTHGIFSKGVDILLTPNENNMYLDDIYVTDSYQEQPNHDHLWVKKI